MTTTGHQHRDGRVDIAARPRRGLHVCPSCDVTWRGDDTTTCWFCGAPGVEAGRARVVIEDETAA